MQEHKLKQTRGPDTTGEEQPKSLIRNIKGQGMVEYLIIISLMAVGTMGMVRVLGHHTQAKLAQVTTSIRGSGSVKMPKKVQKNDYKKKDMDTFFHGAKGRD